MEIAQFIAFAFFAAFAGVVPPGLVNMTVAKTAIEKGKRNGIYAALGVGVVNFFHAFIAILAAKYVFRNDEIRQLILESALIVFAVMAVYFFIMAGRNTSLKSKSSKKDSNRSFVRGFLIANLNILPIPYFVLISTELSTNADNNFDWPHVFMFAISAALGTLTTLYIYVVSFIKLEKRTKILTKYANYFMAFLMLILVIVTLIRIYNAG